MTYASVADVETRLGRQLTPAEYNQAAALLVTASALVGTVIGNRVYDDDEIPAVVRGITVSVVDRVIRNPEWMTQQAAGPFSGSRSVAHVGLRLTTDERAALASVIGRAGVVSVRTPVSAAYLSASRALGSCRGTDQLEESDGA